MAKTKPIGVRFDEELLNTVKGASLATSPQKALNLYEKSYVELVEMKVAENNKPENKKRIEEERNGNQTQNKTVPAPPVEKHSDTLHEDKKAEIQAKIDAVRKELKSPPANPKIGLKMWKQIREDEIKVLTAQLT
jgi:hypothetical protein